MFGTAPGGWGQEITMSGGPRETLTRHRKVDSLFHGLIIFELTTINKTYMPPWRRRKVISEPSWVLEWQKSSGHKSKRNHKTNRDNKLTHSLMRSKMSLTRIAIALLGIPVSGVGTAKYQVNSNAIKSGVGKNPCRFPFWFSLSRCSSHAARASEVEARTLPAVDKSSQRQELEMAYSRAVWHVGHQQSASNMSELRLTRTGRIVCGYGTTQPCHP